MSDVLFLDLATLDSGVDPRPPVDGKTCPIDGAPVNWGHGLMGGGVGGYAFCTREGCEYFHKKLDVDEP